MVKDTEIKPFNIYFEKELRYFLMAISLLGVLGNILDIFTYYKQNNTILISNIITISIIIASTILYLTKIHSIKLSFAIVIYVLIANIIISFFITNPSHLNVSFFLRESIFIFLFLTVYILLINIYHGIFILLAYIVFYIVSMNKLKSEFLFSNIYIIFLMLVSYTFIMIYFSRKLNYAIIEIQKDRNIINEQNEELKAINNELHDSQKLINIQNDELLSFTEDLHKKNELVVSKNDELTEAIKSKNLFFSIVAHDLKSPIASMTQLSELMLEKYNTLPDEKKQHWIKNIFKTSKSLYELLDNLLHWSRTNLGIINPKPEKITIIQSIDKIYNIYKQSLEQKKIDFIKNIDNNLEIVSDKMMLETILRNLVSNAIKYSFINGSIELVAQELDSNIIICVKDHGIGMSEELLKKIDHIENKFSTPGTSGEKGSGLGLHLCKLFTSKLNGNFSISSEVNIGTKICITIPTLPIVNKA